MRNENQVRLAEIKKITNDDEYRSKYEEYERDAFMNYEGRCCVPEADISEIGHTILSWGNTPAAREFRVKHIKFDPSLSTFANMCVRRMEQVDDYLLVSNTHALFFIMMYARLDAYRHSNGLHFNLFGSGVGGTSKTYCFDLLEKVSIPGTVEQLTYETLRANAIDRDNNDTITLMNETPDDMMVNKVGGANTGVSSFKERLTSLRVTVKLFHQDEATGFRDQRVSKSDCIGVWFGVTNESFDKMDEALLTRFFQAFFTETYREGRDIVGLMNANQSMTDEERAKGKRFETELMVEQLRYFHVEKLIMTGGLPDFDSTCTRVYLRKLMEKLGEQGYHPHSR